MIRFYLYNLPGLSLLIPGKTGILYANQIGGHSCRSSELEGYLLPLYNEFNGINQEQVLSNYFTGSKWHGWCSEGIDEETSLFVDEVFRMTPYTDWLKVDRNHLRDDMEAWIYVQTSLLRDTETIEFGGFRFDYGIVTWRNSD